MKTAAYGRKHIHTIGAVGIAAGCTVLAGIVWMRFTEDIRRAWTAFPALPPEQAARGIEHTLRVSSGAAAEIVLLFAALLLLVVWHAGRGRARIDDARQALLCGAISSYEINFTRNRFVSGHECWWGRRGIRRTDGYDAMVNQLTERVVAPEDAARVRETLGPEALRRAYAGGKREIRIEYRRMDEDGRIYWVLGSLHMMEDHCTHELRGIAYVKDIDLQKRGELELQFRAERDSLSGLYNKGATRRMITDFLRGCGAPGSLHAMLMIDLDNFKAVNDSFGHVAGDDLIVWLSEELKSLFRATDVVGRIGGDEFLIFLRDITRHETAIQKAERICTLFQEHARQLEKPFSASVGVAFCPDDGVSFDALYQKADQALYRSKNEGKNTYMIYEPEIMAAGPACPELKQAL